ncbi:FAD binding domain-containing protein [Burkholderia lata]|uniref:FAD binding domain-containing protein n=1 Tax=Burkholderia lata (strain ATCC 17760 / DSM 23089 / LMG 22485 / NCIMB 9086 / R18194 / 383) TaxID=482957 RepID=UPI001453A547|nr:xanthine dehydrogenase family protein subunit M [Burkholderia lata]VWC21213.1 FAD-binding molybdopterin dehydrogenase [Burkholderia lata]
MREFEYLEPTSVQEACRMLDERRDECRMIAGGTALMLAMRQRMLNPKTLVSLGKLRKLRGITYDDRQGLLIGALSLHAEIARSKLIRTMFPMLSDMASHVANPQVRNQGTIGGNLCYADPATDPPSCLMALDARVMLEGVGRCRELPIEAFLVDYYSTALEHDEIVTAIRVPPATFTVGRHVRYLRTAAEHRPLLNIACTLKQSGSICDEARIVIGASTPVPVRVRTCESFLAGKPMRAEIAAEAATILADSVEPISDFRGSGEYRREMIRVIGRRMLEELFMQPACTQEVPS